MDNHIHLYVFALHNSLAKICSGAALFIAATHRKSSSMYFNKQANTWINAFFLTFDFVKALKSVLTNLDLKNLQLHWVSSVAKAGDIQDAKK